MIYKLPDKGDPSDVLQLFPQFNLQLLCCRYWWLKKWEFGELSYPYWRIYWNPLPGATIIYNGDEVELTRDKIIMIAPNTSYSARLHDNEIPAHGFSLEGGRIEDDETEDQSRANNDIFHLFIHFNIGIPYDSLCFSFKYYIERLENLSGRKLEVIHVVGGGSQSDYLNQRISTICGRDVISGPVE
jgi:hypothetical protein